MQENSFPEEKLLKLIKGQKDFPSAIDKKPFNNNDLEKIPLSNENARQWFSLANLSFSRIQKILLVVFSLSCIYLIGVFIYPLIGLEKVNIRSVTLESFKEPQAELNIEAKPYKFYLSGITGSQIFKNSVVPAGNPEVANPVNADVGVTKDIILIGVVQRENLQAIIEDKNTQKTYYVTKGQFIGEFQVEEIEENKVIINYKGQKFELYL